ncbi:hypothetical protein EMIT07CA2_50106 [Brevibacillus sp. IT-7CA2]
MVALLKTATATELSGMQSVQDKINGFFSHEWNGADWMVARKWLQAVGTILSF